MTNDDSRPQDPAHISGFCALPWTHIFGSVDGVWGRCCVDASSYLDAEALASGGGILGEEALGCSRLSPYASSNVGRVLGIAEAFNSAQMRNTRLKMLHGHRVGACKYCREREDSGARSYRQIANDMLLADPEVRSRISATKPDGGLDAFPIYLDLRLGNLCNLACIMCSFPTSSRHAALHGLSGASGRLDPMSSDEEIWTKVAEHADSIRRIYFAGGEPLLHTSHFRVLDLFIERGHADRIDLTYSTNLTVIPDGWVERLRHFKTVDIGVSCDGVGETFERIRVGGRWLVVAENIRRLRRDYPVRLAVTPQRDNVADLDALILFAVEEQCRVDLSNVLIHPPHLSIKTLPAEQRCRLATHYREQADRWRNAGHGGIATELESLAMVLEPFSPK